MIEEKLSIEEALRLIPEIMSRLSAISEIFSKSQTVIEANFNIADSFISTTQAAKMLDISKNAIYQLTMRNQLPFYKSGRKLLFSANEINEHIRAGCNAKEYKAAVSTKSKTNNDDMQINKKGAKNL